MSHFTFDFSGRKNAKDARAQTIFLFHLFLNGK